MLETLEQIRNRIDAMIAKVQTQPTQGSHMNLLRLGIFVAAVIALGAGGYFISQTEWWQGSKQVAVTAQQPAQAVMSNQATKSDQATASLQSRITAAEKEVASMKQTLANIDDKLVQKGNTLLKQMNELKKAVEAKAPAPASPPPVPPVATPAPAPAPDVGSARYSRLSIECPVGIRYLNNRYGEAEVRKQLGAGTAADFARYIETCKAWEERQAQRQQAPQPQPRVSQTDEYDYSLAKKTYVRKRSPSH